MEEAREARLTLLDMIAFPVAVPIKGFLFLLNEVRKMADRELNDVELLQKKLIEVQVLYEIGELDDLAYRTRWNELSSRLANVPKEGVEDAELG